MKDIRLLGDIVRLKLKELQIPVDLYIGIENVILLIITAKYTYVVPFVGYVDEFQSLIVVLISVVYGYKAGLRSMAFYILLGACGVPVFESAETGIQAVLESERLGRLAAYFLAIIVAATLSTYHWDRKILSAIALFVLNLSFIHVVHYLLMVYKKVPIDLAAYLSFSASSIGLETMIGATFTYLCWHLSYTVFPELRD